MDKDDVANKVVKAKNLLSFVESKTFYEYGGTYPLKESCIYKQMFDTAFSYFEHMLREYKDPDSVKDIPTSKRESTIQLYLLNALFDIAHEKKYITDGEFSEFGGFFSELIDW